MTDLTGRLAVVTGGGHGIGRALCRRLVAEGMKVVVADVEADAAAAVATEIGAESRAVDVSDADALTTFIKATETNLGPIDWFVSNAGVGFGDAGGEAASLAGGMRPIADRWTACWEINVLAHVVAARALVPRMIARGGGTLINIASAAGLLSQIGDAAYSATKHAAVGFAESLAITHGDDNIQVAVVCPQAVATRMIGIEDDSGSLDGGFGGNEVDGILPPEAVADAIINGVREQRFLILTHPQVSTYLQRKATDYDRWIEGMRRFRRAQAGGGGPTERNA